MQTDGLTRLRIDQVFSSYDRLVNNTKRSFGETPSRASLSDNLVIQFTAFRRKVHRGARKADRSKCLSSALGTLREAFYEFLQHIVGLGADYHAAFGHKRRDSPDIMAARVSPVTIDCLFESPF